MLLCPWNSGEYWESWSGLWFPSPGELSLPRDRAWVSHITGRFFTFLATREAPFLQNHIYTDLSTYSSERFLRDNWNAVSWTVVLSQFSSVAQSCPTLCERKDCRTPGLLVHHQLLEFTQTHVHWISDGIQPPHPVVPFSSHLQSFPATGSFQMSQFFVLGGQSIGVSASAAPFPMNIQTDFR